jgi:hypothetical protein
MTKQFSPFADPGTVCRSRLTRRPYLRHHAKTCRIYLRSLSKDLRDPRRSVYVLPARFRKERFTWPSLDCPKGYRKPNPVQTSSGNLRDILFCLRQPSIGSTVMKTPVTNNKCLVMLFYLVDSAVRSVCSH